MRCTEVADRSFPDGELLCRDIGDRGRSPPQAALLRGSVTTD